MPMNWGLHDIECPCTKLQNGESILVPSDRHDGCWHILSERHRSVIGKLRGLLRKLSSYDSDPGWVIDIEASPMDLYNTIFYSIIKIYSIVSSSISVAGDSSAGAECLIETLVTRPSEA
ncbi:hypothetical protein CEXT_134051 [Caerostris extrusa]|uniref:Uncharacterized protein n=1 Tax=Caerostris extrusa TaxID=172846 RepID=A0AAV4MZW7_CAEEX|nr:hypothetical protein CEXT_134051 [Caerostris extrusa]